MLEPLTAWAYSEVFEYGLSFPKIQALAPLSADLHSVGSEEWGSGDSPVGAFAPRRVLKRPANPLVVLGVRSQNVATHAFVREGLKEASGGQALAPVQRER